MAREIRATVEFVGEPGKAEINAFARAIVPLLKERAEEIVAMCNAPENRAAFEAYSAEMAYCQERRTGKRGGKSTMNLLIILLVMEQNGMYIPAWAMGLAWVMLVFSGLAVIVKVFIE